MKKLSAYIWAWKNYKSSEVSMSLLRNYYPDSEIFINVDYEGDHENYKILSERYNAVLTRNNFQVGYCGDHGSVKIGKECWTKEETFEWIRGLYEACKKCNSKYMIILEEDDFILKPLTILNLDFSMAIHPTDPSPIGIRRPNYLPNEFMLYSYNLGGIATAPGYGAGGGCIFKPNEFVIAWEKVKDNLWKDYESLKSISKIIGWQDFIVQFVMMMGGYEIVQNPFEAQPWEVKNWHEYEIVCGLKNYNEIYERLGDICDSKLFYR